MANTPISQELEDLASVQLQLQRNTDIIHEQVRSAGRLGTEFLAVYNTSKRLNAILEEGVSIQTDINKSFFTGAKVRQNNEKLLAAQRNIDLKTRTVLRDLDKKENEAIKERVNAYKSQAALLETTRKTVEEQLALAYNENTTSRERVAILREVATLNGEAEVMQDNINTLLKNRKVAEVALLEDQQKLVAEAVKANKEYQRSIRFFDNFGVKVQDVGKRLGKLDLFKGLGAGLGLSGGIAGIFKSLVDTAFQFDNSLTGIAKNSALTRDFSAEIGNNYRKTVLNSVLYNDSLDRSLLTVTGLLKAQQELQAASGQLSLFDSKRVQDQLTLTKQYGLEADQAARIQQLSMLTGQTTSQATDDVVDQVAQSNKLTGLRTSGLEVLKSVAKIEGALAIQYKNNPKLLAAAVAESKALGVSLEQAGQASNALLDFESSIANQLEAELLTGKKFNLEKARSLALDGDAAGAAKEMLKNVGSLSDFQQQNVIARQAEAKAVGMTVDELANALRTQEVLKNSSKETVKAYDQILANVTDINLKAKYKAELDSATNAKELQQRMGIVSQQMQFEESMTRVREAIGQMAAGALPAMVGFIEKITENTALFKTLLVGVSATMAAIAASSLATAFGMTVATGGLNVLGGSIVAGSAAIAAGAAAFAVNDALISPSGGILISTPEGMIRPNKNDSIITTTDPGSVLGNSGGSGKSEAILTAILAQVSKPAGVYIDSTRAGTALGMSYNAYA